MTSRAAAVEAAPQVRLGPLAASATVYVLTVAIAASEVGRVSLTASRTELSAAVVAAVLVVPVHLWHVRYALRGARAPHSGLTLLGMAAVNVVALIVVGPAWSFMLAVLATSALVVLRPPWSLAALAACAAGPLLGLALGPTDRAYYVHPTYLTYAVVFRSVIQFAIVWLAAAVTQLQSTQAALAADAVDRERTAMRAELGASLQSRLAALVDGVGAAREGFGSLAPEGSADRLQRVARLADDALTDLRKLVASERADPGGAAAHGLLQTVQAGRSPAGRGLVGRRAWARFAAVHAVELGYLLLGALHAFFGDVLPPVRSVPFNVGCWLATAALQVAASLRVAQNRALPHPLLWFSAMVVVVVTAQLPLDAGLESLCFLVGSMAVICLPGRWAAAGLTAGVVGYMAYDTVAYTLPFPGATPALVVWNIFSGSVVMLLAVAGLAASAQLVAVVTDLEVARDALAERAVQDERRRMSRDLHDVLGQSLTAVSLKADLARRLVSRDPTAAAREVDDLESVATSLVSDLHAVARGQREVAFAAETESAVDLLERSGAAVSTDVRVDRLDPSTSVLLGWVIREGTTNILRHADSRSCLIKAERTCELVRLEMINDGVQRRHESHGTGLKALTERVTREGGRLESATTGDSFRLYVEVPS